jgi:ATP-dependent helicase HepA
LTSWAEGARLTHRHNPELGVGVVQSVEGRTVVVLFPRSGTTMRIAAGSDALRPLVFRAGARVRVGASGKTAVVDAVESESIVRLEDGRRLPVGELWPLDEGGSPWDRLAVGDVDDLDALSLRIDALRLAELREADGLGSFLGGRIRLFPHQLWVAERATRTDPVRWLLADEVGLGKTVEACLILNRLLRTGRARSVLVVAPETLTVQWLGELWRKYHRVFVLLDDKRLADVERDFGAGFNPFEAHSTAVVSLERLAESPRLVAQAVEAQVDALIVDEAHRLRRPPGHPGDPSYRAIRPIADLGRHVLLLTATPLDEDAHGFFRLLQILRPQELPDDEPLERRIERDEPLPPCTSATRRIDIGGLPPRVPRPIDLTAAEWDSTARLEARLRAEPAEGPLARRDKARRIRLALESGVAVEHALAPADEAGRRLARVAQERDPRIAWLARHSPRWRDDGDKTLVFVRSRVTLEALRASLSRAVQLRTGTFHEELTQGQADIEVAQFRLPGGPSLLVSTECGGEGRNFEFCTRLVLFDLPWNPMTVEQRIGRLDRIGRTLPVEVVYFRPADGIGATVAALYESLGLLERPLGSVERELGEVEAAIEELLFDGRDRFARIVGDADRAWERVRAAAHQALHRDPYRPELAAEILSRVPPELEELTESVVLGTAARLDLHVEPHRDGTRHSIELSHRARVESLPGVPPRSSFLGTFDRDEAVRDEGIDFFASGHPLVEGVLAWLEESELGRVGLLDVRGDAGQDAFGILALYRDGGRVVRVALDPAGHERPEWAERLLTLPLRSRRVRSEVWTGRAEWPRLVRAVARHADARGTPLAVAAFRIGP